ncbi:MAG: hypothetical protein O9327_02000 [Polaromonas sp.]|nr:hypothetical protein [Polaromonas sp.]
MFDFFTQPFGRVVPSAYLEGCYRRLGKTQQEIAAQSGECGSCRHAVAYVTWHCDRLRANLDCVWTPCYSEDIIKPLDRLVGRKDVGGWVPLPPPLKAIDFRQSGAINQRANQASLALGVASRDAVDSDRR